MSDTPSPIDPTGFQAKTEAHATASSEFWKHLTLINATVLGLTVGLMGASGGQASCALKISWVLFILSIAVGCLIVKVDLDQKLIAAIRTWRYDYDCTAITVMVSSGQITREERDGLMLAALNQFMPLKYRSMWTTKGEEVVAGYTSKLPSSSMFYNKPPNRLVSFYEAHALGVTNIFYILSLLAFAFLLVSVF